MDNTYKKIIGVALLLFIVTPSVALASWWNPLTWFEQRKPAPQVYIAPATKPVRMSDYALGTVSTPADKKVSDFSKFIPNPDPKKSTIKKEVDQSSQTTLSNKKIISKVKPAVVYIETSGGAGSGMILSQDGYILTNAHVVQGEKSAKVHTYTGASYSASVVGRDEELDLAVLKITNATELSSVSLGDSDNVDQGDEVFTLGFPFGIKGDVSFKEGTISRRIESYFETSAEIHPGNSGGPLVNRYGQVVGINTAIYGKSVKGLQLGETIKLAIPINTAKDILSDLKAGRDITVKHEAKTSTATSEDSSYDQQQAKRDSCLKLSEEYYSKMVSSAEQMYNSSSITNQSLITEIDQKISELKRKQEEQIALITKSLDGTISQFREIAERSIQSLKTNAMRSGRPVNEDQVATTQKQLDEKVAYYEADKQLQISRAQLTYGETIQKYEELKTKASGNSSQNRTEALKEALTEKSRWYSECLTK